MKSWKFDTEQFGPFLPFLEVETITDITWNGRALWIDDVDKGRYKTDVVLEESFVDSFSARVANYARRSFNSYNPLLEAQIGLFRVSIVNDHFSHTGTTIAIRRTTDKVRLEKEKCIADGFCDEEVWNFIPRFVKAGFSCISGGLPGTGKTEFLKLCSTYIPADQRAIIMEYNPEFHYAKINPESDCTEWKIDDVFTYEDAIKASLRQRPDWNILAEVRGRETRYLMENFSTGINVLTSTHLRDEADLILRLENMIGDPSLAIRVRGEVFLRGLVVAVLTRKITDDGIKRQLAQLCFYSNEEDGHRRTLVVENGKIVNRDLPPNVMKRFVAAGFPDPFAPEEIVEETVEKDEVESFEETTAVETEYLLQEAQTQAE